MIVVYRTLRYEAKTLEAMNKHLKQSYARPGGNHNPECSVEEVLVTGYRENEAPLTAEELTTERAVTGQHEHGTRPKED